MDIKGLVKTLLLTAIVPFIKAFSSDVKKLIYDGLAGLLEKLDKAITAYEAKAVTTEDNPYDDKAAAALRWLYETVTDIINLPDFNGGEPPE